MNKTLVTKLNGRTDNNELLRLGELRILIDKEEAPSAKSRSVDISVNKDTPIEIIGDGYFTDSRLSANNGKSMVLSEGLNTIYVSNDNIVLAVLNKYNITELFYEHLDDSPSSTGAKHKHINLEQLKYCLSLKNITFLETSVTGDISELSNLKSLTYLTLNKAPITGDISSLKELTLLSVLQLEGTSIIGDISSLVGLTNLKRIYLRNSKVKGNVGVLKCYNLMGLYLSNVTFNANDFASFSKLESVILYNSTISGDIALLPDNVNLMLIDEVSKASCTWSSRKSSAKIISMPYYLITDNIDKMLQDQAQCQADASSPYKTIVAKGVRTSASDAAVQTLQSKGYTVSITPA